MVRPARSGLCLPVLKAGPLLAGCPANPCSTLNMSLSAEQHRALTFLTTAALNDATQSLLAAHGFSGAIISGMVNRSLVTLSFERFRAGGKMI